MTNSVNYNTQQVPVYPNITINVTGSNFAAPDTGCCCRYCSNVPYPNVQPYGQYATNPNEVKSEMPYIHKGEYLQPVENKKEGFENTTNTNASQIQRASAIYEADKNLTDISATENHNYARNVENNSEKTINEVNSTTSETNSTAEKLGQSVSKVADTKSEAAVSYPPSYYINNYNIQNGEGVNGANGVNGVNSSEPVDSKPGNVPSQNLGAVVNTNLNEDMSSSKEIITELNARQAEEKETEKNSKKIRVVALTNEYIMSLENYLNNPNIDIRLMAAKDILTRLDEDKDRYDDAALNALLNKMLQDPNKLVRVAALSALSSELASGNQYTVNLLTQIQNDPQADPEDVLEASQILLKRSAVTEVKYVPVKENNQQQKVEEQ